ncbi:MAG: deaminase [Candidatus Gracilibacteria bacterium]
MITKTDYKFLQQLDKIEPKALCLRAQIACMIVKNGKVLVKHTNDWMKGYPCSKIGCIRNILKIPSGTKREICYGICAEQWALSIAAQKGISVKGATAYVSKHPCRICSSMLAVAGIKRVVYQEGYPDVLPNFDILKTSGIKVEQGPNTEFKDPRVPKSHTI